MYITLFLLPLIKGSNLTYFFTIQSSKCVMGFCEICNKEFALMYAHRRTHDPKSRFYCHFDGCTKNYSTRISLDNHTRVAHTKEKPYVCEIDGCDKAFPTIFQRTQHLRSHLKSKPYVCDHPGCQSQFSCFSQLYHHRFSHSDVRYPCPVEGCSKTYSSPYSATSHRKKCHPDYTPGDATL